MQVQVVRLELLAMLDKRIVAISPGVARFNDTSIAGCINGGTPRCSVVGAPVRSLWRLRPVAQELE